MEPSASTFGMGRRWRFEPDTTKTASTALQPQQSRIKNLNTLCLYIETSYDFFMRGDALGRVGHLPTTPIGAGTTFSASLLSMPGRKKRVLKMVRLRSDRTAAGKPGGAPDPELLRASLAESILLELRVLCHPPIRRHENVVNLLGLGWETDYLDHTQLWPVLVVEWANHGTLLDVISTQTLDVKTKLELCRDVARGLDAIHECAVVHGDVKCLNMLVFASEAREHGYLSKIADFSCAVLDGDDESILLGGTWPWNAPERWRRIPRHEVAKSDVYSFGLLVLQVLEDSSIPFSHIDFPDTPGFEDSDAKTMIEELKASDGILDIFSARVRDCYDLPDAAERCVRGILESSLRLDSSQRDLKAILGHLGSYLGYDSKPLKDCIGRCADPFCAERMGLLRWKLANRPRRDIGGFGMTTAFPAWYGLPIWPQELQDEQLTMESNSRLC
jgi:serine/threonine protein kinase